MNKKPFLVLALALALAFSLLLATAVFAQETDTDDDLDLVKVEIRNNSDSPVFIVLTTGQLPQPQAEGQATTVVTMTQQDLLAQRVGLEIGMEEEPDRLIAFGLSAGANQTTTFTVPRGVYVHRTTACGVTVDGVVNISRQLRLMVAPCGSGVANAGEPSMEKIALGADELEAAGRNWQYQINVPQ
jgi:hypothetical protein